MSINENIQAIGKTNGISEFSEDLKYKHMATMRHLKSDQVAAINKLLEDNELSVVNSMGIVDFKIYIQNIENIENTISVLKSVDELDLLRKYPDIFSDIDPLKYYQRIIQCKRNNIEYKDQAGNYSSFITDNEEWNKVVDRFAINTSENESIPDISSVLQAQPVEEDTKEKTSVTDDFIGFDIDTLIQLRKSIEENLTTLNEPESQYSRRKAA